ncbi:MAG: hypothetical protein AAF430_02485 [Myxococcota bacterium]
MARSTKQTALGLAFLVVLFAQAGHAATVTITTDKTNYNVGETITVTVGLTVDAGESAPGAILTLAFSGLGSLSGSSVDQGAAQLTSFGGSAGWTVAALQGQCDNPGQCRLVDQIAPNPTGAAVDPGYSSTVVLTFLKGSPGLIEFGFLDSSSFFGASLPSVQVPRIPEPATAGLLWLGLGALAGRARSRR